MAYPDSYWFELVRSSSASSLVEDVMGMNVWLRTSDGEPLEQQQQSSGSSIWIEVPGDTGEPDFIWNIATTNSFRFRKTGEDWLPSADGVVINQVPWNGRSAVRYGPGYFPGYWAELVRSSSQSLLVEDASGIYVWLRTGDGEPLDQQTSNTSGASWSETLFPANPDTDEPDLLQGVAATGTGSQWYWRARKAGEDWIPSNNGIQLSLIPWNGASTYRFYSVPEATALSFDDPTGDAITGTQNTQIAPVTVPAAMGTEPITYAAVGALPAGLRLETYQEQTASGNEQTIQLPGSIFSVNTQAVTAFKRWEFGTNNGASLLAALVELSDAAFFSLLILANGRIQISLGRARSNEVREFSTTVETSGLFTLTSGEHSVDFGILGADTTEPYAWIPTNSDEIIAFYNAIGISNVAATLTLRDFTPAERQRARIVGTPTEAGSGTIRVRATNDVGTMGYGDGYWAELVRSSSRSSLVEDVAGDSIWLRTSDGDPLEQQLSINTGSSWGSAGNDDDEPDYIGRDISTLSSGIYWRARKSGRAWIPGISGVFLRDIPWNGASTYRFFTATGAFADWTVAYMFEAAGIPVLFGNVQMKALHYGSARIGRAYQGSTRII